MPNRPFLPRNAVVTGAPVAQNRPIGRNERRGTSAGRDAAALVFFVLALFAALALASARFDPHDVSVTGPEWVGPVGGSMARFLLQGFGLVAWLLPVEFVLLGLSLFRRGRLPDIPYRLAGDLAVVLILAALIQVAAPGSVVMGRALAGGNVGLLFGELLRGLFSTVGSFLVGATALLLILMGRQSFSFAAAVVRTEQILTAMLALFVRLEQRILRAWHEAMELRRERQRQAQAAAEPLIDSRGSDEAIIMQLEEDDSDWIPLEATGVPPLAIAEALRRPPATPEALDEALEFAPRPNLEDGTGPQDSDEQEDTSGASAQAEQDEEVGVGTSSTDGAVAPEPVIVDTKPHQAVKRAVPLPRTKRGAFQLPSPELLEAAEVQETEIDRSRILKHADQLEKTLKDYGVIAKVHEIHPGPTVTTYEVAPEAGTKVSKVANLSDDLALGLSRKVRIIAPIPGKNRIGFELPNDERVPVNLRELIEDKRFEQLSKKAPLPVVLGRDIVGAPFYADLASMPHVIVAGATGAGKSVGLNVMLSSLLFRRTPDELRLLMIDPKVVELAPFDGIPHMLHPVVTDMKQAATALRWAVDEMERRYQLFANAGTKNITTYNNWVKRVHAGEVEAPDASEVEALTADGAVVTVPACKDGSDGKALPGKLPFIVIVVDEFADLMMQQGKEVETSVARLAQKARAAGMHVVLATQRPSVDVITGMIKANFPSRIAYRVAQKVDSRTILDEQGAELLLGRGDMLVKLNGGSDTLRVQCPFVSEEEVSALTDYLRRQQAPVYCEAIVQESEEPGSLADEDDKLDARFEEALEIVRETQRCSTSWLQRKMTIGYNRAAKIVEMMEARGFVGPPNGSKDREVLLPP